MRSRVLLVFCSWALTLSMAAAAATANEVLPLTVEDRLAACAVAEDIDPPRAVALAESVLAEGLTLSTSQRASALGCRAWALVTQSRTDEARRDATALLEMVLGLPPGAERVQMIRRVGSIRHRAGDRVAAIEVYGQALADAEAQGLEAERIPLLINLGVYHSEMWDQERARVNYEQALALMDKLDDHRYEAPVRFNLGLTLIGAEKFADSIAHLERALELIVTAGMGNPVQELATKFALANALIETGEHERAKDLVDSARGQEYLKTSPTLHYQLMQLDARVLSHAGQHLEAIALMESVDLGKVTEAEAQSILNYLAILNKRAGNFAAATELQDRYMERREALLKAQNLERLAALEAHLRDREQGIELARLQQASKQGALELAQSRRLQMQGVGAFSVLVLLGLGIMFWQRRMNRRLEQVSRTDPLTGLSNRRDMSIRMRAHLLAKKPGNAVLYVIDVDHFKRVNDQLGHGAGDRLLRAMGERLQTLVGSDGLVARWGGEEFLVLAPAAELSVATAFAESLRSSLSQPIEYQSLPVQANVSIGFAPMPLPGAQGSEAWQASMILADAALYVAKASGRDGWACYWPERGDPEWPAERMARDPRLACKQGILRLQASRNKPEPLHAIA